MEGHRVSINIEAEIWERRRARLKALDSVIKSTSQAKFKCHVNLLQHDALKKGDVDEFIETLEKYSTEERVSLSDIIDIRGPSGSSLLHVAASLENPDILRTLLEVIPDKQLAAEANYRGDTALHIAARAGRIHSAELLLDCDSMAHIANDTGNTALHEAVKNNHYELTRLLLSRGSRAVYPENKESKCPLYLAVETGDLEILKLLMDAMDENEVLWSSMQGMSPVHGAVMRRRIEMLEEMSKRRKELLNLRDAGGGTPLHLAARMGYHKEVHFLIGQFPLSAFDHDQEGYLPIHIACKMGHLKIMRELLGDWQYPEDLITFHEGQNILHVVAKYGQWLLAPDILSNPNVDKLINAKDKEGNTPLHVATLQSQPLALAVLLPLVDLQLENNSNLTARDIANKECEKTGGSWKKEATYMLLQAAGAPTSVEKVINPPSRLEKMIDGDPKHLDRLKDVVNTRMLVATLIAAMTFAAGLSVPGGYNENDSGKDAGFATLLNKPMYDIFVIFNILGLCSSLIAVAILHWSETSDWDKMTRDFRNARTSVVAALAATLVAYIAGVYVTVSKRAWVGVVTLIIGIAALFITLGLHVVFTSQNWVRFMKLMLLIARKMISSARSRAKKRAEWNARITTGQKASAT